MIDREKILKQVDDIMDENVIALRDYVGEVVTEKTQAGINRIVAANGVVRALLALTVMTLSSSFGGAYALGPEGMTRLGVEIYQLIRKRTKEAMNESVDSGEGRGSAADATESVHMSDS